MSSSQKLSNMSYTNKEFNTIYPELLEYAKKVSYKWDPSSSDESDPGVVLLKLAALVGDKDNYNIDKNILELMPCSVSQIPAARQIFDQCGYTMRHYESAEGVVNVIINSELGESSNDDTPYYYEIPRFTMFSDEDNTIVYTSTETVSGVNIKVTQSVNVIEGTLVEYKINNDSLITLQNLDENNRLYFTESNIAQNGIFISNVDEPNSTWKRVDNILIQPRGTKCFKFGQLLDSNICYIELPEDIDSIIGKGLNINYVLSSGVSGNIPKGALRKLYTDTKFVKIASTTNDREDVDAISDKIYVRNVLPIISGKDPETIDEAYKNYQRIKNTFDTLVSLKDYSDYMVTSKNASNCYVCDRTNDIQHTYKVMSHDGDSTKEQKVIENKTITLYTKNEDETYTVYHDKHETAAMNPFNLCLYALTYKPSVPDISTFKQTFQIYSQVPSLDAKSLQHDFIGHDPYKIIMLKNVYSITAGIIPKYNLSDNEKNQVLYNIELALCEALNSSQLEFGQSVPYDLIQQTILNADERIKSLIDFLSPKYKTYAVYKDDKNNYNEMWIDNNSWDAGYVLTKVNNADEFNKLKSGLYYNKAALGNKLIMVTDTDNFDSTVNYYVKEENYGTDDNSSLHYLWNKFRAEIFAKNVLAGVTPLYEDASTYSQSVAQTNIIEYSDISKIRSDTRITISGRDFKKVDSWDEDGNPISYLCAHKFISEPLSGEGDNSITYNETENSYNETDNSTSSSGTTYDKNNDLSETQTPRIGNENIVASKPSLIPESTYSSYVKVLYHFPKLKGSMIKADDQYKLSGDLSGNDDFIIFFRKPNDSDVDYKYIKYSGTTIDNSAPITISPTFNLYKKQDLKTSTLLYEPEEESVIEWAKNLPSGTGITSSMPSAYDPVVKSVVDGESKSVTSTEFVYTYLISETNNQVLTGGKSVKTYNENAININNIKDGCRHLYWILNDISEDGTCTLFTQQNSKETYTLRTGEYFMYTNDQMNVLHIVGQGAKITKEENLMSSIPTWSVPAIDYMTIITEGIDVLRDKWFTIGRSDREGERLFVQEYDQTVIGPGNKLQITPLNTQDIGWKNIERLELTSNGLVGVDNNKAEYVTVPEYKISYEDSEGNLVDLPASSKDYDIRSNLAITISPDRPSKLLSNQEIYVNNQTIGNADIQSSTKVVLTDSTYTRTVNTKMSILKYTIHETSAENSIYRYYPSNNTVMLNLSNENATDAIEFECLPGNYLIQIIPSSDEYQIDSTLTTSDENNNTENILKHLGAYTYYYSIDKIKKLKLNISVAFGYVDNETTKTLSIKIPPLFRYSNLLLNNISCGIADDAKFETNVNDCIKHLTDKNAYDGKHIKFNYLVKINDPIMNPLENDSFFKDNHFYNNYTICEWDTDIGNNMKVHDIVR